MMRNEIDTLLNDLLTRHHRWAQRYQFGKGYPSADIACRSARASRQNDDENGALDAALEDTIMEAFDAALNRIQQPHLTALQFLGRNMATGHPVWRSPRLPVDAIERGILLLEARNKLLKELARDGVLN
jgi:hypothetical protein